MTTNELIEALKAQDPTGNCQVVIGGDPIYFVEKNPGWYDGWYGQLVQSVSKYYNVIGYEITNEGEKLILHTLSLEDVLANNPELPVHVKDNNSRYIEKVNRTRESVTELVKHAREYYGKVIMTRHWRRYDTREKRLEELGY